MNTYKIIASTNGYIASRDYRFKGRTTYDVITNLTKEAALDKLNEFAKGDYSNECALDIDSEIEYVREFCHPMIEEIAYEIGMDSDEYFALTSKRWAIYADLKKDKIFGGYRGPGIYIYADGLIQLKAYNDMSYDYDSRYYSVVEEIEQEEEY